MKPVHFAAKETEAPSGQRLVGLSVLPLASEGRDGEGAGGFSQGPRPQPGSAAARGLGVGLVFRGLGPPD